MVVIGIIVVVVVRGIVVVVVVGPGGIGGDGGNMGDISISAFDPLFWLHHCNMDRHFYTWLYNNTEHFSDSIYPEKIGEELYESTQAPFFDNALVE